MYKKISLIVTLMLMVVFAINSGVNAQTVSPYSLSTDWYFGQGGRLTFPSGSFPNSAAPTAGYNAANAAIGVEASTSVTFNNGQVAVYTNSMAAYNGASASWPAWIRNFQPSPGDNTCAGSSTGAGVSFPDPASPSNAFYIVLANDVTSGGCANRGVNRYRFTGTGTTVAYNAGPALMADNAFAGEAITSGNDGYGNYYVVIHDKSATHTFRVFRFGTDGTITQLTDVTFPAALNHNNVSTSQSYLKFSPCMDKIAYYSGTVLSVHSFDKSTGIVGSELRRFAISPASHGVGLEFSPDGNAIYYSGQGTLVNYGIISSGTTGSITGSASWSLQMGLDGNLYASPGGTSIGRITGANSPGTASYSTVALPGGGSTFRGLSNIGWVSPNRPTLNSALGANCSTFTHTVSFNNYFNVPVTFNVASLEYRINGTGAWISASSLNPFSYTSPAGASYTIQARFNDTYCGQQWLTNILTVNPSCPAPVVWSTFNAERLSSSSAGIYWSTAREDNASHFTVQRSVDGQTWTSLGSLDAAGNSNGIRSYQYIDLDAPEGLVYYRILQVDTDGAFGYSSVMSIDGDQEFGLNVYPNPTNNQFEVSLSGAEGAVLTITDVAGQVLATQVVDQEFYTGVFGEGLAAGTYIVSVQSGAQVDHVKVIKQ